MSRANSHVVENTLESTTLTISFPWPVREVQITNDSALWPLKYKLNSSETYRTLKPYETSTITDVRVTQLLLSSDNTVAYRVWGLG